MEALSERIVNLVTELEPEYDTQRAFERLLENEMIRRLNRYQLTDRIMRRKYGMSFSEFETCNVVEERGYSFEVESDFWDWEMALDGVETIEAMLSTLRQVYPEHSRRAQDTALRDTGRAHRQPNP